MLIIENHLLSPHCLVETYCISAANVDSEITFFTKYILPVHNYSQILIELTLNPTCLSSICYLLSKDIHYIKRYSLIFTISKDIVTLNLFVSSAWCADER